MNSVIRCEDLHDIELATSTPAVHEYTNHDGTTGYVMYKPVDSYTDEHGTVVAHVVEWNSRDSELTTSVYYSRGWAYWNFLDVFTDEFELANLAMQVEAESGSVDYEIGMKVEAVKSIKAQTMPHDNAYWRELVVRMAYNAITNADEFAQIVRGSKYSVKDVQRMIDAAMISVLQHGNFQLDGFDERQA